MLKLQSGLELCADREFGRARRSYQRKKTFSTDSKYQWRRNERSARKGIEHKEPKRHWSIDESIVIEREYSLNDDMDLYLRSLGFENGQIQGLYNRFGFKSMRITIPLFEFMKDEKRHNRPREQKKYERSAFLIQLMHIHSERDPEHKAKLAELSQVVESSAYLNIQ